MIAATGNLSQGAGDARWLDSGKPDGECPADLGYVMGFRITEAYARQGRNQRQAIVDILNIKDFKRFLADGGYASAP
ncbi:hypothetical protein LXA47_30335 [Massilia sp. P8910]|uniref:hypothetical protein n=1 Tax=Massilia antarctica TaxID=2765360 RepID=UPI001E5B9232|nr:hypothetical protein [Massilia antarctica]MCE3607868.1 hypothetical protein [Massilia antarctica]